VLLTWQELEHEPRYSRGGGDGYDDDDEYS